MLFLSTSRYGRKRLVHISILAPLARLADEVPGVFEAAGAGHDASLRSCFRPVACARATTADPRVSRRLAAAPVP